MTYTTTGKLKTKTVECPPDSEGKPSKEKPTSCEELSGDLSCKYKFSGATMTTKLFTSGKLTQEMELDTGVKGLKLTVLGSLGEKQCLLATAEYLHPHVSVVTMADAMEKLKIKSSMTVGMHGVTAGVDGCLDVESKELKDMNAILNYSNGREHEATCMILDNGKKAKFAYSHIRNSDFSVAAEFEYNRVKDSKELTMGTKYEIDRDTTLKTKIDSMGSFSLSYIQDIRKNTTLTICSHFNVIGSEKPSHRFGLALVIE